MNREVYHEGWLVKSPPIKRIWRARWRRRWFTLKQGELPGQFFLEYYTDRNCRKLKGIIDLDQCEQVDAGLRMNSGKHKLPYMFDVKTPRRVYYLAADTDEELKGWVNCICQVCGLQDLTRQGDDRHYFNIGPNNTISSAPLNNTRADINLYSSQNDSSCITEQTDLNISTDQSNKILRSIDNQLDNLSIHNTYQNDDFINLRNSEYSNRETLVCDAKLTEQKYMKNNGEIYLNNSIDNQVLNNSFVHSRSQSFDNSKQQTIVGTTKKIPENLKLSENINEIDENAKPSPSLSTCSGPYIPISECFSGSPVLPPNDLLNSLDPRFYDTPRNHNINIGLNLTNDQPYSPKRNNCAVVPHSKSGQSSPTDSESVFTDDDCWSQTESMQGTLPRNLRPSDSSIENETIGWTYVQRFSRVPTDLSQNQSNELGTSTEPPPRPPKRISTIVLDEIEKTKDYQNSDTENASPAIGPKDSSSFVEQSYDIPRSHRIPYTNNGYCNSISPKLISSTDIIAQSTPNLVVVGGYVVKQNCYTNAAPHKIEGSVFRYDFHEQPDAPAVNRNLKPKPLNKEKNSDEDISSGNQINLNDSNSSIRDSKISLQSTTSVVSNSQHGTPQKGYIPPNVDRKLKPTTPKFNSNSMRRRETNISAIPAENSDDDSSSIQGNSQLFFQEKHFHTLQNPNTNSNKFGSSKSEDKLQYLDLDHSDNIDHISNLKQQSAVSSGTLTKSSPQRHGRSLSSASESTSKLSTPNSKKVENTSGTVYKTVDFLKTEAFKQTRRDVEINRRKQID